MNNYINKIESNDIHIATVVKPLNAPEGLSFSTQDDNFLQVGVWKYPKDTYLQTHYHNEFERTSTKTCESIYVLKGRVKCNLYHEDGEFIKSIILNEQEMILQFNGAHEYIIEEDCVVIENKNGPYFGPDLDRTRI